MECRHCASGLERPGDYCLVCRSANADAVVLELARSRATVTSLLEEEILGERTITTQPEAGEFELTELRNFAGRIADEVRRKRPEDVYAAGDRTVLDSVRRDLHYPLYRVREDEPVEAVISGLGQEALDVVEKAPMEKLGGTHSTLIGDRDGMAAIQTVAGHPHVKKVVPGPIDASGTGSQSGVRAKATRSDANGNVRLLIRSGSSVQENRVVTTARDHETGERVREDLNDALAAADLQE